LHQHNRTHENPDKSAFFCHICGKSFADPYKLKRHESVHRSCLYLCSFFECGKRFSSKELLLAHQRTCKNEAKTEAEEKEQETKSTIALDLNRAQFIGKKLVETIYLNR
jgi:hypothetical protein